jgi:hypothetical protein
MKCENWLKVVIKRPGTHSLTHCLPTSTNIIIGSVHFTPGQAYDECDNGNRSAVHWDLVKILSDGEIWFDGVLIQKQGTFVHKDLLELNP